VLWLNFSSNSDQNSTFTNVYLNKLFHFDFECYDIFQSTTYVSNRKSEIEYWKGWKDVKNHRMTVLHYDPSKFNVRCPEFWEFLVYLSNHGK